MKYFATILSVVAATAATIGTGACTILILDEPKMPKSLLEK